MRKREIETVVPGPTEVEVTEHCERMWFKEEKKGDESRLTKTTRKY